MWTGYFIKILFFLPLNLSIWHVQNKTRIPVLSVFQCRQNVKESPFLIISSKVAYFDTPEPIVTGYTSPSRFYWKTSLRTGMGVHVGPNRGFPLFSRKISPSSRTFHCVKTVLIQLEWGWNPLTILYSKMWRGEGTLSLINVRTIDSPLYWNLNHGEFGKLRGTNSP